MKNKKLLPLVLLLASFSAAGCSNNEERIIIRVLNSADYIYEADEEGYYCEEEGRYVSSNDVTGNDEDGYFDKEGHEVYYDSDMMKQFVSYMNDKYADEGKKFDYIYDTFDTPETCYNELMTGKSNYDVINVSDYMVQKMMSHNLIQPIFGKDGFASEDQYETIASYMSPYLWGEDNSIFNKIHSKKLNYEDNDPNPYEDKLLADYSVPYMWGTIGIMYNYDFYDATHEEIDEEFSSWEVLYNEFASKSFSIKDSVRDVYAVSILHAYKDQIDSLAKKYLNSNDESSIKTFNQEMTKIFNKCDEETIKKVKEDMLKLKDNAFGFEVDSGKTDMVSGEKIGANLAWSGDAAWAIYEAETESGVEIAFEVPDEGSNIWFDAWCIPTVANHPEYALDFIEFMSEPTQAIANMDYVGYTSATAGDEVLDYIYDNYDVRAEEEDYPDEEYIEYDLTYFFDGSLEEHDIEDAILHAWTTSTEATYEELIGGETVEVSYAVQARMLKAQFPSKEQLPRLCVMDDYGKDNEKVLDMWQSVRTNALPLWAIIIFILEAVMAIGFIAYLLINNYVKRKLRKKYSETH